MIRMNPLYRTDSYKISHPRMYPDGVTELMTYTESRGTDASNGKVEADITWLGFQMFAKELADITVTHEDNEEARDFYKEHFLGADIFPYEDIKYMIEKYDGKIPALIRSVPEGLTVPSHNVMATVRSTDERLFWMTSFLETMQLRASWYGASFATNDMEIATIIYKYLLLTSDAPDALYPSRNHDFGARGSTSSESAAIGGAVHTLISGGSDTVEGIAYAKKMYGYSGMPAFSIPASEHSVTTAHGKALEHLIVNKSLTRFPGAPLVANVIDSYDMMNFVNNIIGVQYKQDIIDSGKLFVLRPDSGDAVVNVVMILQSLEKSFGVTVNGKGYKVLNHVAVINGDGNDVILIEKICTAVMAAGFALDNVAFGTGGGLHQKVNRDTYRWATKLCLAKINGIYVPIQKDPITDPGKKSRGGDLDLVEDKNGFTGRNDGYTTIDRLNLDDPLCHAPSVLETTYFNGTNPVTYTFEQIRERTFATIKEKAQTMVI